MINIHATLHVQTVFSLYSVSVCCCCCYGCYDTLCLGVFPMNPTPKIKLQHAKLFLHFILKFWNPHQRSSSWHAQNAPCISLNCWPTDGRLLAVCRPSIGWLSATCRLTVYWQLANRFMGKLFFNFLSKFHTCKKHCFHHFPCDFHTTTLLWKTAIMQHLTEVTLNLMSLKQA